MIPKKIHYCWFGGNPLPESAQKCINSWKEYFPSYEIIQWDESNFDISACDFMKKAYEDKKWAFVSDVARLLIIYEHGGLYFDTDVEVISSFNDILSNSSKGFMGLEQTNCVASGLGFGAEKGHPFLKELISFYETIDYNAYKNNLSEIACTVITTDVMKKYGLDVNSKDIQSVCDFSIYPVEYFSPIDYNTGKLKKTKNTHSIHWYDASWQDEAAKKQQQSIQKYRRVFGTRLGDVIFGVVSCIKKEGFFSYIFNRIKKLFGR